MFPYPSGAGLHMGHALVYTFADIYERYKRSKGFNVLNPMGFDAFGLPTEQFAIQTGQHPNIITKKNIENFKKQLNNLSLNFNWDESVDTSSPEYYKHTQYIFILMFNSFFCLKDNKSHDIKDLYNEFSKHGNDGTYAFGDYKAFSSEYWNSLQELDKYKISLNFRLAYQDETFVNWCPKLGTVLANDEVKNGYSERGGYPVEKKKMKQWFLRITAYANRLLQGLDYNYSPYVLENFDKEFNKDLKVGLLLEKRKIILAIIKHWSENKYLIIKYKQDNSKAFLTGGIDENESPVDALIREIREETGFVNIRKIKYICRTDCAFHHLRKNKNLMAITYNYYVELKNEENIEIAKEERNILDFEWIEEDKIEDIISYEEHIYPFKILRDKILKLKVFSSELKPNLPIIRRNAILAVIKHWQEDKYLIVNYKKNNQKAFLTGGIEDNEDDEEGLIREIKEKSGFIDIKKIIYLCQINSKFYNEIKDINRDLICQCYFVELNSNENIGINDDEKRIQECEWIEENQVENIIDIKEQLYAYRIFKDNFRREIIDWPESTKEMQRNWIGKSQGASIFFEIENESNKIEIFTTRPETIFGVTFIAISKDHVLNTETNENNKTEYFTGKYAIHPFKKKKLPIWVADYVLSDYGTGAVMAVPAHDQRDYDFAKKHDIEIINVINNNFIINSDFLNNLSIIKARETIINKIESLNIGQRKITYRLRDAIFGRQRYWGEPIPIYYKDDIPYVFSEDDLPLELPDVDDFKPAGESSPLAKVKTWKTNEGYQIETSTMPGWAGSSWYFMRYTDPHNDKQLASLDKLNHWGPIQLYIGGPEHATGHLIYSRFYSNFLYDIGLLPYPEPFKKLIHQGMILGNSAICYRINGTNTFVSKELKNQYDCNQVHIYVKLVNYDDTLDIEKFRNWRDDLKNAEFILNENGKYKCERIIEKMSKSKYNTVDPDEIVEEYGTDTLRTYLMFLGPIDQNKPWNDEGIEGIVRFLRKVEKLVKTKITNQEQSSQELKIINKMIKAVEINMNNFAFNTAVSSMMICINELNDLESVNILTINDFLIIFSFFAPNTANKLFNDINKNTGLNINEMSFPKYDEQYIQESMITYPISINGKKRATIDVDINLTQEEIEKIALNDSSIQKWINGNDIKKIIFIKNKMINLVI